MNTNHGGVKNISILMVRNLVTRPQVSARRNEKIDECSDAYNTQKKGQRQSRPEYGATMHVGVSWIPVNKRDQF